MTGAAHRGEFFRCEVLHLVDEHRDTDTEFDRSRTEVECKVGQICVQRSAVSSTLGSIDVEPQRHRPVRIERHRERRHRPQRGPKAFLRLSPPLFSTQRCRKRSRQPIGERGRPTPAVGLDTSGDPAALLGASRQVLKQHRLADTAQPGEHDASSGSPSLGAVGENLECLDVVFSTGQLRRTKPGPGRVRVPTRIHTHESSPL